MSSPIIDYSWIYGDAEVPASLPRVVPGEYSRAQKVIQFTESLTVPDGPLAGRPLILEDFEKDFIYEVYTRDQYDRRIVNDVLLTMARKNGKTSFIAGLCLCHLCGPEAVLYGQLYSLGYDRDQASILYNLMMNMVYADQHLSYHLKPTESEKKLVDPSSRSVYKALSSEARSQHGKSSSFVVFDELAQFGTDRKLYDTLKTSVGAHGEHALSIAISTQAPEDNALLSELVDYGIMVNNGEVDDPHTKTFIYVTPKDKDDAEKYNIPLDKLTFAKDEQGHDTDEVDPFDEGNWRLSNPGLGTIRSLFEMRQSAKKARQMPSAEVAFRNLYLNQRVDSFTPFLSRSDWLACKGVDEPFKLEDFRGRKCFAGLDLSGRRDLTSLVLAFPEEDNWEGGLIDLVVYFWTPDHNLKEKSENDKVPYDRWVKRELIEAVPGKTIDYAYVANQLAEINGQVDIVKLGFDRWRIEDLKREMNEVGGMDNLLEEDEDPVMVPIGQGFKDMNPTVEIIEEVVLARRLRHGGHPVLTWCVGNTVVERDAAENRKFTKLKSHGRIDGTVATAQALRVFQLTLEEGEEQIDLVVL